MAFFHPQPSSRVVKWTFQQSDDDAVKIGIDLWNSFSLNSALQSTFFELSSPDLSWRSIVSQGKPSREIPPNLVSLPRGWSLTLHKSSENQLLCISPLTPTILSSVFVIAMTPQAYLEASNNISSLRNLVFSPHRFLEEGETLTIGDASNALLRYRLQLLEPDRRGCAQAGVTNLTLLSPSAHSEQNLLPSSSKMEAFEIGDEFLASTVCRQLNVRRGDQSTMHPHNSAPLVFHVRFLETTTPTIEDNWTLYVKTGDLGKLGILSGDWAIASASASCATSARLVKIVAHDQLVEQQSIVKGYPTLLHNLTHKSGDNHTLVIAPIDTYSPAIPTAHSMTLARINCSFSANKKFQAITTASLKRHLLDGMKLVKKGDIFSVPVDVSTGRWIEPQGDEFQHSSWGRFGFPQNLHATVYFQVTSLHYDIVRANSSQIDFEMQSSGELGCWIDPNLTKIVQSGTETIPTPVTILPSQLAGSQMDQIDQIDPNQEKVAELRLLQLVRGIMSKNAAGFRLDTTFLLEGARGIGKFTALDSISRCLGLHLLEVDCYDLIGESAVKTEAALRVRFEQARAMCPCMMVLRHVDSLSQNTSGGARVNATVLPALLDEIARCLPRWKETGHPVIIAATSVDTEGLPQALVSCFKHVLKFGVPDEGSRLELLKMLTKGHNLSMDILLPDIAMQTASLLALDLRDLVYRAKSKSMRNVDITVIEGSRDVVVTAEDFNHALVSARTAYSESIGAPKIPAVSWDDVGGLAHVKTDILDTIQLPLEHPEMFSDGLKKRSGILLYGPPGTGKTLVAKAVATSCSLNFFSVKGPELLNMYIGESEANVRRVFQRARDAKPCVIFFDELDSVAPKRGNHGDSGGVMDRIVSQLLAELDGMSSSSSGSDVFVIGATNRPDLLDPALLRPGRFDRMLYLGVSQTHEAQLDILEALTRKFKLDPGFELGDIAEKCPFNYTGADFYALCSDAMLNAMSRTADAVDKKIEASNTNPNRDEKLPYPITPQYFLAELASPEDIEVQVSAEDFEGALRNLVPSVSQAEMEHYAQVQQRFSQGGGVKKE